MRTSSDNEEELKMEKTYNPALIQRTQRYMETHSISQNQFAAKVNLSSAALSLSLIHI